jgi:nitrilase
MRSKIASLVGLVSCAILSTAATVDRSNITVAGVVAPPPHWPLPVGNKNWTGITLSLSDSVNYAAQLISEAGSNGADLIAFPELWIPA